MMKMKPKKPKRSKICNRRDTKGQITKENKFNKTDQVFFLEPVLMVRMFKCSECSECSE